MVMGTASTMACMVEALGMTLPDARTIPATHADRLRAAEATARAAGWRRGAPTAARVADRAAFRNALVVLQAIGGSTNAVIHLTAIAGPRRHSSISRLSTGWAGKSRYWST